MNRCAYLQTTNLSGADPRRKHEQVRKLAPRHLRGVNARRTIHITAAMFSCSGEVVATYNDEVLVFAS